MVIFIEGSLPSQDCKMIKLLTTDDLFLLISILAKAHGRMTTAITFSRQNDAGSRARTGEKTLPS